MYLLPVMAQLDLKHRTVIPEGVDVDIEILILIYKIVALLLQRAERGIGQLQQLRVFVLGQALLVFDDLASGAALLGLIIDIMPVQSAAADIGGAVARPAEIGLHDINPFAGGHRLKLRNVRMLDKELQAAALRSLLAQKRGDLVYQPQQLIFIVGRIIYDAQVRVPRPRGDQPVVQPRRLLGGFRARAVVVKRVVFLRADCRRHHVEHRVVAVAHVYLVHAEDVQHLLILLGGHVGLVVERTAVADDEHLVRVHPARHVLIHLLLGKLEPVLRELIIEVAATGVIGHAAAYKLRAGLRNKKHRVALHGKRVLYPALRRGFSRAWAAGYYDFCYLHLSSDAVTVYIS